MSVRNEKRTVHLETTYGLDFNAPKFPYHVIYSRYRFDEENPYYMPKKASCAILVVCMLKLHFLINYYVIFSDYSYLVDLLRFSYRYSDFFLRIG